MKILITGATGFIASQIITDLLIKGHSVTLCVRNLGHAKNLFPEAKIIKCNFVKDTSSEIWIPRLKDIDIVVNCVGILHHPNKKIIWAIHNDTPRALFDACVKTHVKKIIQISALGIDKVDVDYAMSKKSADDYLLGLSIQSLIFRPSLVYGKSSYGGTSLFRGLSGLPFFIPTPGKGQQSFQPIHINDLSKAVVNLIESSQKNTLLLHAVGPKQTNLGDILKNIRAWLGFKKAMIFHIPFWLIWLGSFFGNFLPNSSMNKTSYKMLMQNNVTTDAEVKHFTESIGFTPRDFLTGLYSQPSSVQDHWHARLYFLKPLLQISIAFIWIYSGFCSLYEMDTIYPIMSYAGINPDWQSFLLYGASILDILLGFATLVSFQLKKVGILQCFIIIIYTIYISWKIPVIWLDPFTPLAKNIPLFVATLIMISLESDR